MKNKYTAEQIKKDVENFLGRKTKFWFGFSDKNELAFSLVKNNFNDNLTISDCFVDVNDSDYKYYIDIISEQIRHQELKNNL